MPETQEPSAQVSATPETHRRENTFKNYDAAQAQKYADYRPSYDPRLLDLVIKSHTSTGGRLDRVLDIGCGPGIATRQIAGYFQHVVGVDAGVSMVETAKVTPCFSATGEQADFHVCNAEEVDTLFEPESIDLITVATAAHWFDMADFYPAAAKILKPGGSIAMWCGGSWYVDAETTPNAESVQDVWTELETEILKAFEMPGNQHCRELYIDVGLPWTVNASKTEKATPAEVQGALDQFDRTTSTRREFNRDGKPDPDPMLAETGGYLNRRRIPLDLGAKMFGTASQVTRWRAAHKEQLEKGEIEDCVNKMLRLTREEMNKAPEVAGRDWIDLISASVLIVVKKKL